MFSNIVKEKCCWSEKGDDWERESVCEKEVAFTGLIEEVKNDYAIIVARKMKILKKREKLKVKRLKDERGKGWCRPWEVSGRSGDPQKWLSVTKQIDTKTRDDWAPPSFVDHTHSLSHIFSLLKFAISLSISLLCQRIRLCLVGERKMKKKKKSKEKGWKLGWNTLYLGMVISPEFHRKFVPWFDYNDFGKKNSSVY